MTDGNTINICNVDCTKFLGHTIGVSPHIAQKTASANMKKQILQFLQCIDKCSIQGEYKMDFEKLRVFCSTFSFTVAVERLTAPSITVLQHSHQY